MSVPTEMIAEIEARTNIVDVIGRHVSLKPAGASFKGLCPFHSEKTPSFFVNPDKGFFHCFGCGVGGGVINFMKRVEGISFTEALEILAAEAGVSLGSNRSQEGESARLYQEREKLYDLNRKTAEYYHDLLGSAAAAAARDFLSARGVEEESSRNFGLGYAADSWDALLNYLRSLGFSDELIAQGGLIIERKSGKGYYDRFRNRLIFPIIDGRDRTIGFGGRLLGDEGENMPKYVNSPETPIYSKRNSLYGLNLGHKSIVASGQAVIVEGYMDLISLYQRGVTNVVASSGTSLTEGQAEAIRRYAQEVVILYDSDAAGSAATSKGLDVLVGKGLSVRVAFLPPGHDPDSFIREEGSEALLERLQNGLDLFDYRLRNALESHDISTTEGKKKLSDDIIANLLKFKNDVQIEDYIGKTQELLRKTSAYLDEAALRSEIRKTRRRSARGGGKEEKEAVVREKIVDGAFKAERVLVGLMLKDTQFISKVRQKFQEESVGTEVFSDSKYREIAALLLDGEGEANEGGVGSLSTMEDDSLNDTVSGLLFEEELGGDWEEEALNDMIRVIADRPKRERWRELGSYITQTLAASKPVETKKAEEYKRLTKYLKG